MKKNPDASAVAHKKKEERMVSQVGFIQLVYLDGQVTGDSTKSTLLLT